MAEHSNLVQGRTGTRLRAVACVALTVAFLYSPVVLAQDAIHPTILAPQPIDWVAVAQDYAPSRAGRLQQLPGFVAQKPAFDATTLPVLLPASKSGSLTLRNMTFSSFGDAYGMALPQYDDHLRQGSVAHDDSDVTVVITATRSFVEAAPGTLKTADFETLNVGGKPVTGQVFEGEGGWTASFNLYGALYSVDVDCGNQGMGSPCKDSRLIRQVIANLSDIALGKAARDQLAAAQPTPPPEDRGEPRRRRPPRSDDRLDPPYRDLRDDDRPDPEPEVDDVPPQPETPRTEVPPTEVPRTEVPEPETPRTEVPRTDVPRTEGPRTDVPVTETPRVVSQDTRSEPAAKDDTDQSALPGWLAWMAAILGNGRNRTEQIN